MYDDTGNLIQIHVLTKFVAAKSVSSILFSKNNIIYTNIYTGTHTYTNLSLFTLNVC